MSFPKNLFIIFKRARIAFGLLVLRLIPLLMCPYLAFAQLAANESQLAGRMEIISRSFLGLPYASSPLGEGSGIDNDPLIRFDQFDCTTYVETVGALALTFGKSKAETILVMNEIRYSDGKPSIATRNHFTSLDWVKNNVQKGLIEDLTRVLFPEKVFTVETSIDKKAWFLKNFEIIFEQPIAKSRLDVIRIRDILNDESLLNRIPHGSIVNFVMNNSNLKEKIGTDLDVSHQGLVFWINGKIYLRHARSFHYGVIEEPLIDYLKFSASEKYGFNINRFKPLD